MKKNNKATINKIISLIIVVIIPTMITVKNAHTQCKSKKKSEITIKGHRVFVEIADSEEERKRGLMWRKALDKNSGMLFIYKDSRIRYFWMKNTYISLDIAFIDTNLVIKTIHTMEKTDDSTTLYSSYVPVQYVLEVNSGWLEQRNIHTGDTVTFDFNLSTP